MPRSLLIIAFVSAVATAGEGFWPLHSLPLERIKDDTGVALSPGQIQRAMKSAVFLRMANSGGSGGVISGSGLLVTNQHVIIENLGALSSAAKNYVRDGFLAARREDELPCKGLRARILISQEKLTDLQAEPLKRALGTPGEFRARRQLEQSLRATRGPCEVVSLYGGGEFWLYCYKEYTDVRLVFTPDEGLGDFGGRLDNFEFPRHEIDIALLRLYENGQPAQTPDFLPWATIPLGEKDPVFILGHPAENERSAPQSYIRYLCDVKLPAQSAVFGATVAALEARLKEGGPSAARVEAELHRMHNRFKHTARMREILSSADVQSALEKRENGIRKSLADSTEALALVGTTFEDCADACARMKSQGTVVELTDLRAYRLNNALMAMRQFSQRAADLDGPALKRITLSIQDYFRDGPLNSGFNAAVEEAQLCGILTAIESLLPADHALRMALLNGKAPADVARQVYRESKLAGAEGCCALVEQGAQAVQDSRDLALQFFRALDQYEQDQQAEFSAYAVQDQRRQRAVQLIRRAQFTANPNRSAPDANRTVRISYGATAGYTENGVAVPWRTTFRSQVERAESAKNAPPYALSPLLKESPAKVDPETPLNFAMSADGGPGCSGAPVLDRNGHVAGVMFDGNRHRVASLYYFAPMESGARSIGVHGAAIEAALRLAGADAILKELLGPR